MKIRIRITRSKVLLSLGVIVLFGLIADHIRTSKCEVCKLCGRTKTSDWLVVIPLGATIQDKPVSKLADEVQGGVCTHQWELFGMRSLSLFGGRTAWPAGTGRHTQRTFVALSKCLTENRMSTDEAKEYLKKLPIAQGTELQKLEGELEEKAESVEGARTK